MAPESGSGRATNTDLADNAEQDMVPAGWVRTGQLRVYELSADHPDFPERWRSDEEQRATELLARSNVAAIAIRDINARWAEKDAFLDGLRNALEEGRRDLKIKGNPNLLNRVQEAITEIDREFLAASYVIHAMTGVPHEFIVACLARAVLPADLALYWSVLPSPIHVIVNAEERTVVMVALHPGEYVVKGQGVGRKDVAERVGKFITEAQDIIQERRGQRRRRGPEINAERALAVAHLKKSGLTATEICDRLSLAYRSPTEAREVVRYWRGQAEKIGHCDGSVAEGERGGE